MNYGNLFPSSVIVNMLYHYLLFLFLLYVVFIVWCFRNWMFIIANCNGYWLYSDTYSHVESKTVVYDYPIMRVVKSNWCQNKPVLVSILCWLSKLWRSVYYVCVCVFGRFIARRIYILVDKNTVYLFARMSARWNGPEYSTSSWSHNDVALDVIELFRDLCQHARSISSEINVDA